MAQPPNSADTYAEGPEAFASGPNRFVGPTGFEPMTFWV